MPVMEDSEGMYEIVDIYSDDPTDSEWEDNDGNDRMEVDQPQTLASGGGVGLVTPGASTASPRRPPGASSNLANGNVAPRAASTTGGLNQPPAPVLVQSPGAAQPQGVQPTARPRAKRAAVSQRAKFSEISAASG
ncbi:hypothetical protein AURDEDRAFT_128891 [Auricularia subglabra TFB-10046 SS5]|nr:hypothetical protein AURDEDRAFT_128891 [Auricularia subglabra TFB-10046 SS5]